MPLRFVLRGRFFAAGIFRNRRRGEIERQKLWGEGRRMSASVPPSQVKRSRPTNAPTPIVNEDARRRLNYMSSEFYRIRDRCVPDKPDKVTCRTVETVVGTDHDLLKSRGVNNPDADKILENFLFIYNIT